VKTIFLALALVATTAACGARSTDLGESPPADSARNDPLRIGGPSGCFAFATDTRAVYATNDVGGGDVIAKLSGDSLTSLGVAGGCPFAVMGEQVFVGGQRVQPKGAATDLMPTKSWTVDSTGLYRLEDTRIVASEFDTHLLRARLDGTELMKLALLDHVKSDVVSAPAFMHAAAGVIFVARADKLYRVSAAGGGVAVASTSFEGQRKLLDSFGALGDEVYWAANHAGGGVFATAMSSGATRRLLADSARKLKVIDGRVYFVSANGLESIDVSGDGRGVVLALPATSNLNDYLVAGERLYWSILGDGTYTKRRL